VTDTDAEVPEIELVPDRTADFTNLGRKAWTRGEASQAVHLELAGLLSALINSGQLEPGVRLPPERAMCKQFGVSRTTIRQVLGRLEQQNLITRHVGRGTYVAEPKVLHSMSSPASMATQVGDSETYRLIYREPNQEPPEQMRDLMTIAAGATVTRVARLRSVAGRPTSVEVSHFPDWVAARLPDQLVADRSVGAALADAGIKVDRVRQRYDPVLATPWEAEILDIDDTTPLMLVTRRSWDDAGRVVEYALEYHRADRNTFLIEVFAT